jgi:zinc resistance-associated protein
MLKSMVAATVALAVAGSTYVYAQQRFGGADGVGGRPRELVHYRPSVDDLKAFTDARIAALKAGLQLTPEQEKNWPAFEQSLRELAQLRIQRIEARRAREDAPPQQHAAPFDRLSRFADAMAKRSAALKHIADAGAPLYQSLTDAQ